MAINMKLCVHVLLLALGVISGQKCDEPNESNECDISSHLHLATKATEATKVSTSGNFISEFKLQFNPFVLAPNIELKTAPGATFDGCLWFVKASASSFVASIPPPQGVGGTADPITGLILSFSQFPTESFTLVLSAGCPSAGDDVANLNSGTLPLYDAIGVPHSTSDEQILDGIKGALGSVVTNLIFVDFTPQLVFREGSSGSVFQVVDNDGDLQVYNAAGTLCPPDAFFPDDGTQPTIGLINPSVLAGIHGDPHIHTLDGGHYTLLREGSFLLWHFGAPQPHVEWQIFAHYAGRQSFTKGLLLVDTSGSKPSSMEITSERCEWQTQGNSKKWSRVNSTIPEVLLSGPSSRMKLLGNQRKDTKKIQLLMADEQIPVATLKVMCRQGRHISMKLQMTNQKWKAFVSGELKGTGKEGQKYPPSSKNSMLQLATREDQEFEVKKTWAELGGSFHAQQYLQKFDEHPQNNVLFIQNCDHQAQDDARTLCQKHLGSVAHSSYLEECVYDVCTGGGEVAAEMAAEMLKFWAAPSNNGLVRQRL